MAAATAIRTINIAAQAATMVAVSIEGAQSSEGALLCEAELQSVGGARMLPIVVDAVLPIVVVDAGGKQLNVDARPDWRQCTTRGRAIDCA
jgi:hypothetical protein